MSRFARSSHIPPLLRQQYLASLEEPQEWFLEELISEGQVWVHDKGAYCVTHEKTLVEFFSIDQAHSKELLREFWGQSHFSTAIVKSYDFDFVRSCRGLGWTSTVGGFLFRKRNPRTKANFDHAEIRAATGAEVSAIWRINDGFFESEDEVKDLALSSKLWIVKVNDEIAGCGVSNCVSKDSDAVDIGMLVASKFRRKGLGTYIVSEISDRFAQDGLRPVCGCGASNAASRATLEKAGFVSEHQLLSFTP